MTPTELENALRLHQEAARRCRDAAAPDEAQAAIRALQEAYARVLDAIVIEISAGRSVDQDLFARIATEHKAAFDQAHGLVEAYLKSLGNGQT